MPLQKLSDFDPNYSDVFEGKDIKNMGVYTDRDEKVGTVSDALVDDQGNFRYLIVDLGFWIFGKKVLLPVGRARIDYNADRVSAVGMTKEQAENLPEYSDRQALDYDYEERVRGVYRGGTSATTGAVAAASTQSTYNRDSYTYQEEPSLYDVNNQDNSTFKLYQERLIANKTRTKTGEVAIGKRVETETQRVSVPIEKERVVVERVTPADAGRAVDPNTVQFGGGEVARMEIYEETPDIRKEAFVREEVRVTKQVEHQTVEAEETLRREELDIDSQGRSVVDKRDQK